LPVIVEERMTELRNFIEELRCRAACATVFMVVCGLSGTARAQVGTGWVETTFEKRIHLDAEPGEQTTFPWGESRSVCSPVVCADYSYDSASRVETFRILDSRSNRSEIRLRNDYSTGIRQFEGYLTFDAPLHDESLFQIFGNSRGSATYLMMRGYRDNGGELRVMSPAEVIASGVYGKEVRINIIHEQNAWARFYVNGRFVYEKPETDTVASNYWKYGCYGTTRGNVPAVVKWRAVRTFRDGRPPDGRGDAGTGGGPDAAPRDGAADAASADAASGTADGTGSDGPGDTGGSGGSGGAGGSRDGAPPRTDGAIAVDAGAAGGNDGSPSMGAGGNGGAGPGGTGGDGLAGAGGPANAGPDDPPGGCSCRVARNPGPSALITALPLLVLAGLWRRPRRSPPRGAGWRHRP
jgi:MYXO-CTERM domain-containing protein